MTSRPILFSAPMANATVRPVDPKTQTRRVIHPQPDAVEINYYLSGARKGQPYDTLRCYNPPARFKRCGSGWSVDCPGPFKIPGKPGDQLWGKETFKLNTTTEGMRVTYRADKSERHISFDEIGEQIAESQILADDNHWRPSIYMSKWASRIHLEITAIRCERVQSITEEDAIAEGLHHVGRSKLAHLKLYSVNPDADPELHYTKGSQTYDSPIMCYSDLWNSINLKPSPVYQTNPASGKKEIVSYISYPWSQRDFDDAYPDVRLRGKYKDLPITIVPNPWVWAITFKPVAS